MWAMLQSFCSGHGFNSHLPVSLSVPFSCQLTVNKGHKSQNKNYKDLYITKLQSETSA